MIADPVMERVELLLAEAEPAGGGTGWRRSRLEAEPAAELGIVECEA